MACLIEFCTSILPLYCGPHVKIRIDFSDHEYTVSKGLLCAESSYFSAILEKQDPGSQQQTATLSKVEGIVSRQSVEALIQWLYLRMVIFDVEDPGDQISAAIELVRLADLCSVSGLEPQMARFIKKILVAHPNPQSEGFWRHVDTNTYCLTPQHIAAASHLPQGHLVRRILAAASVEGYLRDQNHKFAEETQEYPSFGADLLWEVGMALNEIKPTRKVAFKDPISGHRAEIKTGREI
ncbi:uncharacterized protein N7511_008520 [Penicillium nucicola]|uniref:uncharacterized protein n=1 Tax=Penicillium nucicola TaxID=1850975 RepID=UPI0025453DBC|nr:uncharacterized protein N7511_011575 [Penicillium nucicola]XP_056978715.1 uncharacterized protein N7511_011381 [Penicillium nucicola]XP_056981628.1 uncharacterized protein N7511_008520 [Penicillium nucicola]KAJ5741203.1 hypothetical protein N7511_011575 [Penicillium nucicola]KAJ5742649.1 hypothetical protein N7511_011381 [Penicillium nucicola]KAJ5751555.1 hypothetical protein N7511_008520 [Penicillium nucicola]